MTSRSDGSAVKVPTANVSSTQAHPLADLFPLMTPEDLAALVADIREHGLRVPIVVYQDQVLDGRNRLAACIAAGVGPRFQVFEGTSDEALAFVLSMNLTRRHLTTAQRAALAVRLLPFEETRAHARRAEAAHHRQDFAGGEGRAIEVAGSRAGVSSETVRQAARIADHAPEVLEAMTSGVVATMPEAQRLAAVPEARRPRVLEHLREHGGKVNDALSALRADPVPVVKIEPRVIEAPGVRLLYGVDVLDGIRLLADQSVHMVATSPPFWRLRDYGVPGQIGQEVTVAEYVGRLVEVFREVRRVLRDDGTLWVNLGDSFGTPPVSRANPEIKPKEMTGVPWRVAFALQEDGWLLRSDIIWHRLNPLPDPVTDRPTRAHEYVFLLTKDASYYYDADAVREPFADPRPKDDRRLRMREVGGRADGHTRPHGIDPRPNGGRNRRSVWTLPTQPFPEAHFATMPEALVEPMILAGTSAFGACARCGSPWSRLVSSGDPLASDGGDTHGDMTSTGRPAGVAGVEITGTAGSVLAARSRETTGWQPTCACGVEEVVPCSVLDPFSGSGTTGKVARDHGRTFVGIDLQAEYLDMARRRIGVGEEGS